MSLQRFFLSQFSIKDVVLNLLGPFESVLSITLGENLNDKEASHCDS